MAKQQNTPTSKPPENAPSEGFSTLVSITMAFVFGLISLYMLYSIITVLPAKAEKPLMKNEVISGKSMQVELLNGCGASRITETLTSYLRSNTLDVIQSGNYISYTVDHTIIIDRTGNAENAKIVARLLGISEDHCIQQLNKDLVLDVTVIIGKDYLTLTPFQTGNTK